MSQTDLRFANQKSIVLWWNIAKMHSIINNIKVYIINRLFFTCLLPHWHITVKGKKSKDIKQILKEEWECYALKQDSLNDTLSV